MTVPNFEFDSIVRQHEDPALLAAQQDMRRIERQLNEQVSTDEEFQEVIEELNDLNASWPYTGDPFILSGMVSIKNHEGVVVAIADCKNETVISQGFDLVYLKPTPDNDIPSWHVAYKIDLLVENDVLPATGLSKDILIARDTL